MDNYNLSDVFEQLVNGEKTVDEVSEFMCSNKMRKRINYYLNSEYVNNCILTEDDLQEISLIIKIAQFIYNYSDKSTGLTDQEFDILYEKMTNSGGQEIISVANNTITELCHHKFPSFRGTLDKIYYLGLPNEEATNQSRRSLDQWITSTENDIYEKTGKRVDISKAKIMVYPKFDGISCIFEFDKFGKLQRVLTRGYTSNNTATNIVHMFPNQKFGNTCRLENVSDGYAIKTEVMVANSDLEDFNKKYGTTYKNTRSIASGILNSIDYDKSKCALLKVIPLRYGNNDEMYVCEEAEDGTFPSLETTLDDRQGIKDFADKLEYIMPNYRCDGAVIKLLDDSLVKLLGIKDNKVKSEVAFKFTEVRTKSVIKKIEFQSGLFGNISPVAVFEPVKLKGNTITKASLGSIARTKYLNLSPDDEIIVCYDIVPFVHVDDTCRKSGKSPFQMPDKCEYCGAPLISKIDGSSELQCVNKKCPARIYGRIINYATKMRILNISYATVNTLMREDYISSIADLYKLYKHEKSISKLDGFGKKRVKTMLDSIDEHRNVSADEFFGSIGIENASIKTFRKILSIVPYRTLIEYCYKGADELYSLLSKIDGIGELTASKLAENLVNDLDLIEEFEKLITLGDFNIYDYEGLYVKNEPDFTVCFTKIRDSETEKLIKEKNGLVVDSVNKNTTYLVVPYKDISSSKVSKAKKHSVQILELSEFKKLLSEM